MLIKATIPTCHPVEENGKSYTVFVIEFYYLGHLYKVEKRYRTFHSLHKQLKKVIETPEFPPKRVRNWNPRVLEQRRKDLERYLQVVLQVDPVPKSLLGFLEIPSIVQIESSESLISTCKENTISHQPVVTFITDPFVTTPHTGSLTDIVVIGVMQGLYDDAYLMSASADESKTDDSED